MNINIFSNQILLESKYCLFQFIQFMMQILKDIVKNYNIIINGKSFCDLAIDSDIKRFE